MKLLFKNYTHLTPTQSACILELRNLEYIRTNMKSTEIIALEKHLEWVQTLKNDTSKEYFALILDEVVVGSCSWMREENNKVSWGIYFINSINPLVSSLSAYLFIEYLFETKKNTHIESFVRKENILAYKFNQHLGFSLYKEDESFFYLNLTKEQWVQRGNNRFIISLKKYLGKIEYEFQ
ncbi:MAG: hypothetical protein WC141_02545 [Arcobacteraceae bacterium]